MVLESEAAVSKRKVAMKVLGLILILLVTSVPPQDGTPKAPPQDYRAEIDSLLRKLIPVERPKGHNTVVEGPSSETRLSVLDGLSKIASESPESRAQIIESLIGVLEDPVLKREYLIPYRWTMAVDLLGDLGAVEAIDALVRNLDETGENGIVTSLHHRPVASAIGKIGAPAIPRLIEALSDEKPEIASEAASTLARIGSPAINKLDEALRQGNSDTKAGAALALAWIGGPEAEAAIKHAIETETDQEALRKVKDALKEMRSRWGK